MGNVLDRILDRKREEIAERRPQRSEGRLLDDARSATPTRGFIAAIRELTEKQQPAVIAEVKRASPSKGLIHKADPFDPAAVARGYKENGAACISCLTDRDYFQGHEDYLSAVREAIDLPVLRKDFLIDPYQIVEARAIGADAVLLIMAALEVSQALELENAALELGMDVLVEVHDETELEAAHELKSPLLGVNNRNLKTFETDLETTFRLGARAERDRIIVSESGISSPAEIARLAAGGVYCYLVGGALMQEENPGMALARLLEVQ